MTMQDYRISHLSPIHPNNQVGIYGTTGGDVSYGVLSSDFSLPYAYLVLSIGSGGDIVFQDHEGNNWARYGVLDGSIICTNAKKILVTGTVNGVTRTTTCQKITWELAANLIQK